MKWSFATVGIILLGLTGVAIILLFQQITTNNENDYYLLKEITEAAMVDAIDVGYYRETGNLKIVKEKHKQKRKLSGGKLALVIAGSPIWGSLLIAFVAVIFALYVSIFAVVVSLWSVFVSFIASAFAGLIVGIIYMFGNNLLSGLAMISAVLVISIAVSTFIPDTIRLLSISSAVRLSAAA